MICRLVSSQTGQFADCKFLKITCRAIVGLQIFKDRVHLERSLEPIFSKIFPQIVQLENYPCISRSVLELTDHKVVCLQVSHSQTAVAYEIFFKMVTVYTVQCGLYLTIAQFLNNIEASLRTRRQSKF